MKGYCPVTGEANCKCAPTSQKVSPLKIDLKASLRKLFTDHAVYTAFVLKSIVDDKPDAYVFLSRLVQNQKDIGDQLKPLVGNKNGSAITVALTEHIRLAGETITSATRGEPLKNKVAELYNQGDQIAKFLSSLNSAKLPLKEVTKMFRAHNKFVVDMTVARIKKEYHKEQVLYDAYYNEILMMSDAIFEAV